jgi:predicted lipoprotein with Yx(FWY)xxD motif
MAGALFAAALPMASPALAGTTQVVVGKSVGIHGTIMVAATSGMTLYTFTKDVAGSGVSNCTGGCLTAWPALTIAAGDTPTGDGSVTGSLGTITRTDNGQSQVTYNGLPLYFFSKDTKPGDTNGIYPNWEAVTLVAAVPTAAVAGRAIGSHGTLLVAASNSMTLYTFTKDEANSGTSNCTGGCLAAWPALTIDAGQAPTGDASVAGKLDAITRSDNGKLQVTYNGLPLYFFSKDTRPGDTNGIYPNWEAVTLAAATPTQAVAGRNIAGHGTLLVAASNDMTLYTFTKDEANSGTSNCTGGCLAAWPALTVAAGQTPTGGAGVTGTLGTITRADNGEVQVTYNGLPLYFFSKDTKPGDTNGIYPNWEAVVLAAAAPAPTPSAPTPAPTSRPAPSTLPPTSTASAGGTTTEAPLPVAWILVLLAGAIGMAGATRRSARRRG